MKKHAILALGLFFVYTQCTQSKGNSHSSSHPRSYKIIPIVTKETFTLNSGGRAMFGGKLFNETGFRRLYRNMSFR